MKKGIFAAALAAGLLLGPLPAGAVTLVHTNDVMGELEPCGCRNNPLGGMARKANLLKRTKDPELIQVDTGDTLFATEVIPPLLLKQARLQAEYLLESMDMLHHDALVPGEKDFALGDKVLDELRAKSKIHFLAANLRKTDHSRPFEKHLILTKKTPDGKRLRVALFGIVGEGIDWPKGLKATPAIQAAKAEVKALRGKADLIIALTHQGVEKDKELAAAVKGIDLIVGAHSRTFIQDPLKVGSTFIYQSSFRNQYVGVLPLVKPFKGEGYELTGLDPGYDSPAGAPTEMDKLVKEFKAAIADLNTREEEAMRADPKNQRSPEETSYFQTFPRCSECHAKQFDFWRKTRHAEALAALIEKKQDKNKECLSCHTVGLGDPHGYNSVTVFAELRKREATPDELIEHDMSASEGAALSSKPAPLPQDDALTTDDLAAYLKAMRKADSLDSMVKLRPGDPEGMPLRQSLNRIHQAWTPVQCENCHQPGQDHPFSGTYSKKVETGTCLKCHSPDRAPEWYAKDGKPDPKVIEAKRAQVTCPAGD